MAALKLIGRTAVDLFEGLAKTACITEPVTERDLIQGITSRLDVICTVGKAHPQGELPVTYPHDRPEKIGKAADT